MVFNFQVHTDVGAIRGKSKSKWKIEQKFCEAIMKIYAFEKICTLTNLYMKLNFNYIFFCAKKQTFSFVCEKQKFR